MADPPLLTSTCLDTQGRFSSVSSLRRRPRFRERRPGAPVPVCSGSRAGGARRIGRRLAKPSAPVLGAPLVALPFGPVGRPKRLPWHMGRREWLGQKKKRRERKREGKKKKKKRGHVGRIPSRAEPDENEMGCTLVILACELFSFFSDFMIFFSKKFISRPYELGIRRFLHQNSP